MSLTSYRAAPPRGEESGICTIPGHVTSMKRIFLRNLARRERSLQQSANCLIHPGGKRARRHVAPL